MSYTKSTDFANKDTLLTGDTNKKIRGSEIDTEFNNLAVEDAQNVKLSGVQTLTDKTLTSPIINTGDINTPDIDGGTVDGTVIGGATPAAITGTTITGNTSVSTPALTATSSVNFAGATVSNLGTVTTADINGGTIDGAVIGGASAASITGTTITASTQFSGPHNGTVGATTPAAGTFTTLTSTGNAALGDAEATDTHAIKGATTILSNSASAALTVTNTGSGNSFVVEDSASTDSTPFVIDASGNTSIGHLTTGLSNKLNIYTSGAFAAAFQQYSADNTPVVLTLSKTRSTSPFGNAIVSDGDSLGRLQFVGNDGASSVTAAWIQAAVDGTPGTNDMPGRLVFSTTADGASSPTERMRIDSAGNVGIGGTPSAGMTLYIGKNQTGATTTYGVINQNTVLSDVTSSHNAFYASLYTQAAAFTLTSAYLYRAEQGTIGATSAVTNQFGYFAGSSLTGATNNYGFYSNIAAATGRWNFYAAGTASNYFAGLMDISASTAGQIKFPATQNASADANTLDDYEEGDWSPAISSVTVGNLSVTYSTQYGRYTKVGRLVTISFHIATSAFTHTTASGLFRLSGLPFVPLITNGAACGGMRVQGLTKATYTSFGTLVAPNDSNVYVACSGSGVTGTSANITDFPTAGTVEIYGTVSYIT